MHPKPYFEEVLYLKYIPACAAQGRLYNQPGGTSKPLQLCSCRYTYRSRSCHLLKAIIFADG